MGVVSDASWSFLARLVAFGSRRRAGVEAHAATCRELRARSAYRQGDSDCVSCEVLGFTWRGPVGASPVSPGRAWAVGGGTRNPVLCIPCASCCAPPEGRANPEQACSVASTMRVRWLPMPASFVSSCSTAASRLKGPGRFAPPGPSANLVGASKVRCWKATLAQLG